MKVDKRTLRAVGAVLVALVAVLAWWFQADGADPDKGPGEQVAGQLAPGQGDRDTAPSPESEPPMVVVETDTESGLALVPVEDLPAQAEDTLELIDAGGPFPYDRDGVVFGNYEGILPKKQRGHYHEYTVPTPGLSHRGARRIVTGDDDEFYWTADHYASFQRIDR